MTTDVPPLPSHSYDKADLAAPIVRGLLILTLALCVVVPHSFQLVTAVTLLVTFAAALISIRQSDWLDKLLVTYFIGVIVTALYVWIGYMHRAPREAVNQTLIVYIVAPLIWLIIGTALMQLIGIVRTVRILVVLTWAAVISVALFFMAFLLFGREAVRFLSEDANVNVSGGFAGANILVYGSMIFLAGALFAQPMILKGKVMRVVLPGLVFLAALTSGRSALILAVPLGLLIGTVLRSRMADPELRHSGPDRSVVMGAVLLGLVGIAVMVLLDALVEEIDLSVIVGGFLDELFSGGGSERTEQTAALWEGIQESYGLGVGHGIGVAYLRSAEFPWRYEVLPLATLLRVGVLGTIGYMSTFIVYGLALFARAMRRELLPEDIYMAGGFIAVVMATFTNPYLESFVFQWMFFLPVLSLAVRPNPDIAPSS